MKSVYNYLAEQIAPASIRCLNFVHSPFNATDNRIPYHVLFSRILSIENDNKNTIHQAFPIQFG